MSNEIMRRELKEAIDAGERALNSLKCAKSRMDSAKNWGLFDMFGGGMLSSMVKHSQMRNATSYMEDAKRDLQIFQRELQDINVSMNLKIEVGSFLTFADFFFDGIFADYLVQCKIEEAREQINDAIRIVGNLLAGLKREYNE